MAGGAIRDRRAARTCGVQNPLTTQPLRFEPGDFRTVVSYGSRTIAASVSLLPIREALADNDRPSAEIPVS